MFLHLCQRTPENAPYTKKCWQDCRRASNINGFNENPFISKTSEFTKMFSKWTVLNSDSAVTSLCSHFTHSVSSFLWRIVLIHRNLCIGFHTQYLQALSCPLKPPIRMSCYFFFPGSFLCLMQHFRSNPTLSKTRKHFVITFSQLSCVNQPELQTTDA